MYLAALEACLARRLRDQHSLFLPWHLSTVEIAYLYSALQTKHGKSFSYCTLPEGCLISDESSPPPINNYALRRFSEPQPAVAN